MDDFETLNRELGQTLQKILHQDEEAEAVQANGIFLQNGLHILELYLKSIKECHSALATEVNFIADPSGARNTINQWIARHTNHMIEELMPPSSITANTRLVLANALYFKG